MNTVLVFSLFFLTTQIEDLRANLTLMLRSKKGVNFHEMKLHCGQTLAPFQSSSF